MLQLLTTAGQCIRFTALLITHLIIYTYPVPVAGQKLPYIIDKDTLLRHISTRVLEVKPDCATSLHHKLYKLKWGPALYYIHSSILCKAKDTLLSLYAAKPADELPAYVKTGLDETAKTIQDIRTLGNNFPYRNKKDISRWLKSSKRINCFEQCFFEDTTTTDMGIDISIDTIQLIHVGNKDLFAIYASDVFASGTGAIAKWLQVYETNGSQPIKELGSAIYYGDIEDSHFFQLKNKNGLDWYCYQAGMNTICASDSGGSEFNIGFYTMQMPEFKELQNETKENIQISSCNHLETNMLKVEVDNTEEIFK